MKKRFPAFIMFLAIAATSFAQNTHNVYVWSNGHYTKIENADSITFNIDKEDNNTSHDGAVPASVLQSALSNYVGNVVIPTYEDLQNAAETLHNYCVNIYNAKTGGTALTQSDIDAACAAFKTARRCWNQSLAFLYGPAVDDAIDPCIDSWPLDQIQMADALTSPEFVAGITGSGAAQKVYHWFGEYDSTLGFHGLEYMLFRNGANRTAAAFNAKCDDGSGLNVYGSDINATRAKLQTVTTLTEAAFMAAVSENIRNMTKLLEYEWDGSSTMATFITNSASWVWESSVYVDQNSHNFTAGMPFGSRMGSIGSNYLFDSYQQAFSYILSEGCENISTEIFEYGLGEAYRVATGQRQTSEEGSDIADYFVAPYSKRSFQDFKDMIYGIRNVLYGVRGTRNAGSSDTDSPVSPASNSIMAILNQYYPEAPTLQNALTAAIDALEAAQNSGTAFVDKPGDNQVKVCIDAVSNLDAAIKAAANWFVTDVTVSE